MLTDGTAAFQGIGNPVPVIEAPQGGANILSGIGIYTNGINARAVALKWMAGKDSMVNDVRFLGGHGTSKIDGSREDIYNNTHTADPNLNRRWDGQYPSLWVTNGGGGRFVDIWTPSTFARAGMYVSDTSTEGRVYEMSSEHHVRNEVVLRNVLQLGRSTRCRPKRSAAKAVSRCPWTSRTPATSRLRISTSIAW